MFESEEKGFELVSVFAGSEFGLGLEKLGLGFEEIMN
jgi:hypothetical protein